jgi:dTDP-4-amino-4,6-dideoxygalactose transaminase
MSELAILGGRPAFPDGVPFARPSAPPLDRVMRRVEPSYSVGRLTNGPIVRAFEEATAERLGVDHVVAVSSCTAGLMLAIQAFETEGAVVLPSFTFCASAHAAAWNGLDTVFAECDPTSFQLDVTDASARAEDATVAGVLATHVFGAPCDAEAVEKLGRSLGVPVIFDAAHGFGALRGRRRVGGFGDVEVFSLSPTKPLVAGEGGLVATNDGALAERVRLGRDYGNPGDYNSLFAGLNARMSELHAAVGIESLSELDANLERRRAIADRYTAGLQGVTGVDPQVVAPGDVSTYKDYTVRVDPEFGLTRDDLVVALAAEGVETRCYFSPAVHRQQAYAGGRPTALPVTEEVERRVLSLPIFTSLSLETVDAIVDAVATIGARADQVRMSRETG